jgi:hypothetical protein
MKIYYNNPNDRTPEVYLQPVPGIAFSIPLLVRLFEYVREDVKSDVDVHKMLENLIPTGMGQYLDMSRYLDIVEQED